MFSYSSSETPTGGAGIRVPVGAETLLDRTWRTAIPWALSVFVVLQGGAIWQVLSRRNLVWPGSTGTCIPGSSSRTCSSADAAASANNGWGVCNADMEFSAIGDTVQICVVSVYFAAFFASVVRSLTLKDMYTDSTIYGSFYVNMVVSFLAGFSEAASYYLGGKSAMCTDMHGVTVPLFIFIEWFVTVPFLVYIALSLDTKSQFSVKDKRALAATAAMIFFGALLSVLSSPILFAIVLLLSCMAMYAPYTALYDSILECNLIIASASIIERNTGEFNHRLLTSIKKRTLVTVLAVLFPTFPIVYFLGIFGFISATTQLICFNICGVFTKIFFNHICCDAHQEVGSPAVLMLDAETKANKSRRAFLRYIFHEVRVPLNSFSMGVELLADEGANIDIVQTLRDSCASMSNTLNDILSLQKIEEGAMKLQYRPFSAMDMVEALKEDVKHMADAKNMTILITPVSPIPFKLFGDKFRLGHALRSIVVNAIKFGRPDSEINIYIEASPYRALTDALTMLIPSINEDVAKRRPSSRNGSSPSFKQRRDDLVLLVISVKDSGVGIGEKDLRKIFEPYLHTRPEENPSHSSRVAGRGAGVSLAISKEIISRHHGVITCKSKLGVGTIFEVSIPISVVEWVPHPATENRIKGANFGRNLLESVGVHSVVLGSGVGPTGAQNTSPIGPSASPPVAEDGKGEEKGETASVTASDAASDAASAAVEPPSSLAPAPSLLVPETNSAATSSASATEEGSPVDKIVALFADPDLAAGVKMEELIKTLELTPLEEEQATTPLKALVVDDVSATRKMLSMMLKVFNIICDTSSDGVECVQAVKDQNQDYDVIFMDNTMPNMTGVEATMVLRRMGFINLIIGVTGNCMESDLAEFSAAGADLVMSKPLTRNAITSIIKYIRTCGNKSIPGLKLHFGDGEQLIMTLRRN